MVRAIEGASVSPPTPSPPPKLLSSSMQVEVVKGFVTDLKELVNKFRTQQRGFKRAAFEDIGKLCRGDGFIPTYLNSMQKKYTLTQSQTEQIENLKNLTSNLLESCKRYTNSGDGIVVGQGNMPEDHQKKLQEAMTAFIGSLPTS